MSDQDISSKTNYHVISGRFVGERVTTRILEEQIQEAVAQGHRALQIDAYGQHGIGGRLHSGGRTTRTAPWIHGISKYVYRSSGTGIR